MRRSTTLFPYTTLFRSPRTQSVSWQRAMRRCDTRWIAAPQDRKSTRLNSSHGSTSYAVFCLKQQFDLRESTDQIVASLRPVLKKSQLALRLDVHSGITM